MILYKHSVGHKEIYGLNKFWDFLEPIGKLQIFSFYFLIHSLVW